MTDFSAIAAPLAAALSKRGYESLTPVQTAVIDPELAQSDALVSAQTGSGKTVAFGLAIAPTLLGEADKFLFAAAPLALIVAPTRELAQQVQRELEWLYAEAGGQIATCVGGMDYRTERRALERGAHIVVGTPGRLRDHIDRGSLDMSEIRAVVLDEADEMLDLGFAEDLEFILGAAPEERRTLLFSATVPKGIEALARQYQRDAVRIQTASESKQHVDIDYRALSVAPADRDNAIINLLRFYEARLTIVFCKTRAEVSHMQARFHNRGFSVVALSGELSQSERMHALQALRDGRARVCIATDVAARGIDLPGLELVVHADLPSNSETLLHRSGRTGRAGNKGVSALIVTPREYKKAQRLLSGARVQAAWGPAPSADEVRERDAVRLMDAEELVAVPDEDEATLVADLLAQHGPDQLAAGFLRLWRAGRSAPEELMGEAPPADSARKSREAFGDSVWYEISVGRNGRAEPRWLLPKLCDHGRITKTEIGAIRVQENVTYVQIAAQAATGFEQALGAGMALEEGVALSRMAGEPVLERPERRDDRPARGPREDRPARAPREDRPARAPREDRFARGPREDRPARPPREDRPARAPREDRPARAPREDRPKWTPDDARPARAPRPMAADAATSPDMVAGTQGKKAYRAAKYEARDEVKPAKRFGVKPARRDGDFDGGHTERSPARAPGSKPAGKAGGKPFGGKPAGDKPYGAKPAGARFDKAPGKGAGKPGGKPFSRTASGDDTPRKPRNPADTSQRMAPPRKPRHK